MKYKTLDYSLDNIMTLHKELWLGVADQVRNEEEPDKEKVIKEMGYSDIFSDCFLCEYADNAYTMVNRGQCLDAQLKRQPDGCYNMHCCRYCPVKWHNLDISEYHTGTFTSACYATGSPFNEFELLTECDGTRYFSDKVKQRIIELCETIANLPVLDLMQEEKKL